MFNWTDDDSEDTPLDLARDLGHGKPAHRGDVMGVADALDQAGVYDKSRFGNPPLADEHLFKAIERFQDDQGLEVDGLMKPGGPTVTRLNAVLGRHARSEDADAAPIAAPAPAPDDGDGPRFVDLFRARREAGAPEGFGPAFDIFEPDAPALQLAQARIGEPQDGTHRSTPRPRPTPPDRNVSTAPPANRRYPSERTFFPPEVSSPPELPELPTPQRGMGPVGQRPDGSSGQPRPSFRDRIAWAEHSDPGGGARVGYGEVNGTGERRMLGRYQFSPELLTTIGMHGDGGAWTGALARRLGIRSERNFLNSPTAQDAAFDAFVLWAQRQARSALPVERQGRQLRQQVESIHWIRVRPSDFIGRSIEGIRGRIVVTLPGLVAAMHRRGPTDVARYLRRISENGWSSNEVNLNDREREIETQLRVFSAEPLSTD